MKSINQIPNIENYAPSNGQVHSYLALKKVERMAIEKGIEKQITVMLFGHLSIEKLNQLINHPSLLDKFKEQKVKNPEKVRGYNRKKYAKRKSTIAK